MAVAPSIIIKLADLEHSQIAHCLAALAKKERSVGKNQKPYLKCTFCDNHITVVAMVWSNDPLIDEAHAWGEGLLYRLKVEGDRHPRYGMQIKVLEARPVGDDDVDDGYNLADFFQWSHRSPEVLYGSLLKLIEGIDEPCLKRLVLSIVTDNAVLLKKMPAANKFHHAYNGGLLEHIWSMTRVATFLVSHYSTYYERLDPPLDKSLVLAATILHDIGKLKELSYNPFEATYSTVGSLLGHIVLGRDMVREAASKIDGFPPMTLLRLEHAILSHHGRQEYGSPVVPSTIEALLLSHIDDLDAKMNQAAGMLMKTAPATEFTEKIHALDNRRLFKGTSTASADAGDRGLMDR